MGKYNDMVMVDGGKLKNELHKRGITMTDASIQMGRTKSYIAQVISNGKTTKATIVTLKSLYNIDEADISPSGEVVSTPQDMEALKVVIREAVKEAFVWYANQR